MIHTGVREGSRGVSGHRSVPSATLDATATHPGRIAHWKGRRSLSAAREPEQHPPSLRIGRRGSWPPFAGRARLVRRARPPETHEATGSGIAVLQQERHQRSGSVKGPARKQEIKGAAQAVNVARAWSMFGRVRRLFGSHVVGGSEQIARLGQRGVDSHDVGAAQVAQARDRPP